MKLRIRISFFLLFAVASVNGINYLDEMRLFVMKLAQLGRQTNRNLIVIPQNGVPMMTVNGRPNGNLSEEFLRTINGWGQEDLFYGAENDNQATPQEATNELNSFFNRLIVGRWPIKIMVTDYCSDAAKIADSNQKNSQRGYISFTAGRELTDIPNYPGKPNIQNENAYDINDLSSARNFLYLLNSEKFGSKRAFLQAVQDTNYDAVIIDKDDITQADLQLIRKKKNGGRRLLLAYISVGAAEKWRWYWQKGWTPGYPAWLDAEIQNWQGNFFTKYWMKEWQDIVFADLQTLVNAGFDGIYMDGMDTFEHFRRKKRG